LKKRRAQVIAMFDHGRASMSKTVKPAKISTGVVSCHFEGNGELTEALVPT